MTAVRSSEAERGRAVVAVARRWIGTPYRHQASCEGAGADCLGLLRGVWREVMGPEPQAVPGYTPDWAEATGEERLLGAALRYLVPVEADAAMVGDVCLFRMRDRGPAKHVAILVSEGVVRGRIIHAYSGHAVCETGLGEAWRRRLAGVFRFPAEAS
ncbi:MAG: NlpC/P60 family protein [Pseudomonadota bacterium]